MTPRRIAPGTWHAGAARLRPFGRMWGVIAYAVMIASATVVVFWISATGEGLFAPHLDDVAAPLPRSASADVLSHALLTLALIVVVTRAAGVLCRLIGQPAVIGEVIGGIVLGPSLLGYLAPVVSARLLPPDVLPFLQAYAQLGVILYLFLVGLEFDPRVLATSSHVTLAISHASIIVPMLLGSALALVLYPVLATAQVTFTPFALFLGVSLSITAFPVLARILTDLGISRSRLGTVALACAAIDDVTAWCLLALVIGLMQQRVSDAIWTLAGAAAFLAFMLKIVARPIPRLLAQFEVLSAARTQAGLGVLVGGMLLSAAVTEYIGLHAFLGAFLFGAIVPRSSRVAKESKRQLEDAVTLVFLPAFFALTGMRTQIGLVIGGRNWLLCALIVAVACIGKMGGTLVASWLSGLTWRDSLGLAVLMNTRGLVELIVLNLALDLHVISPTLFAMLVIMALLTTFMATPLLRLAARDHAWAVDLDSGLPMSVAPAQEPAG